MAKEIALTPDLYMSLSESEKKLSELDSLYDKAEECGVDCQQMREIRQILAQRSMKLRQHFAPSKHLHLE